ncbi:MAG TPA: hypothetical protein DSN98_03585 [Thermoplasmata archaeon]|jgi:hypothetical protein|nr:MAG TPA: hypothetical protein DSN98_03585 [Thermoplasmata archaeon]
MTLFRKGLVILTILLFVGTCIIPTTAQNILKPCPTSRGDWLYVGGGGPGNYSKIQDAIDNASDGDTVFVYSGTYPTSGIYIEKAIQLIGENRNTTNVESSSNVGIYIKPNSHNVAINNFTFQNFAVETHYNNNISISDNIFLTTVYYGNPSVIDSSGSYNTFKGNTIILRHTTEEEIGPNECMGLNEYHSTIVNNTLVGATYTGLSLGGRPTENEQYGLNIISRNTFSNNEIGLYLSTLVTTIGRNNITQNNFINNSDHAGFTISVLNPFDLIHVFSSLHRIPFSQWDGNYWDDYTGHLGRKIPGKIQFFSTRFEIPVRNVDRHPAPEPIYLNKKSGSATSLDTISNVMERYSDSTMTWGDWWPDFPGRYESFFEVKDIIDFGQTAWGLTTADFNMDGLMDFAVSWATNPWTHSTISIFYNDGDGGYTQDDVYTTTFYLRYIEDLSSGDYDNDGDIDLLFTYSEATGPQKTNGVVDLLLNDGSNHFVDCVMVTRLLPTDGGERRINPQVSSADFDDDGDIDFLVGDNSGLVEFYRNNGSGVFTGTGIYDFGEEMSWGLSSADFDGDGDIDFIVTQSKNIDAGRVLLVPNDGTEECFNQSNYVQIAVLPPRLSFFAGPVAGFGCLCTMDYDDDGRMDFLFSGGDSLFLYMQNETGGFDYFHVCRLPAVNVGNGTFYADQLRVGAIATGDFNGDGLDDLVVGGVQGVVRLFINQRMLVDIIFPDREGIIIHNEYKMDLLPFYFAFKHGTSFAFGRITVIAKELEPLQKVEFYRGNKLMYTDDAAPYEWNWTGFSFGRHIIKAVPYDLDGKQAGYDTAVVWKFF